MCQNPLKKQGRQTLDNANSKIGPAKMPGNIVSIESQSLLHLCLRLKFYWDIAGDACYPKRVKDVQNPFSTRFHLSFCGHRCFRTNTTQHSIGSNLLARARYNSATSITGPCFLHPMHNMGKMSPIVFGINLRADWFTTNNTVFLYVIMITSLMEVFTIQAVISLRNRFPTEGTNQLSTGGDTFRMIYITSESHKRPIQRHTAISTHQTFLVIVCAPNWNTIGSNELPTLSTLSNMHKRYLYWTGMVCDILLERDVFETLNIG